MSIKRSREPETSGKGPDKDIKRQKKGFTVGPDHLPDGTYRRRVQKIKRNLIDKAKVRKEYAKVKQKHQLEQDGEAGTEHNADAGMHPERVSMIESEEAFGHQPTQDEPHTSREEHPERRKRPWKRSAPFSKEQAEAEERRNQIEARRAAREESMRQREQKQEERERFRRAMAKARTGGRNGQRKLGRESKVLLDKVHRMVGQ